MAAVVDLLAIMNAAMNIHVSVFISLGLTAKSESAIFNFFNANVPFYATI